MHCVYEVQYDFQWASTEPTHWERGSVRVLAGLDAQDAVDKAKQAALALGRLDQNGREEHCTGFRLRGVTLIAEADL